MDSISAARDSDFQGGAIGGLARVRLPPAPQLTERIAQRLRVEVALDELREMPPRIREESLVDEVTGRGGALDVEQDGLDARLFEGEGHKHPWQGLQPLRETKTRGQSAAIGGGR